VTSAFLAPVARAQGGAVSPDLAKASDLISQNKHGEALPLLQKAVAQESSEAAYVLLGNALLHEKQRDRALQVFQEGTTRYPMSARLWNAVGLQHEAAFNLPKAVEAYRRAVALEVSMAALGGGRYDQEFDTLYIPVVHDHRGANSCAGRVYVYDDKIHYVVYHVASGIGLGNDDSFETPFTNIAELEVDRKKGAQAFDYSIITLITNQSSARRRIASGDESRLDLKFTFGTPIHGYRGNAWTKAELKFFFVEPETGESLLKFMEAHKVKSVVR
jgi:tetratricopeptide (TPR) repeat protein